jgi:membrane protein implicated in regulation of membrane protease activity
MVVDLVTWVMIGVLVYTAVGLIVMARVEKKSILDQFVFLDVPNLLSTLAWPLVLVLQRPGPSGDPGHAGPEPPDRGYVGAEAEVVTDLRPWGTVRVGGQPLDARAETGFVAAGGRVRVVGVERRGLVVRHEPA